MADTTALLTADEAAGRLRVSQATLNRMVSRGRLPKPIKLGRRSYWDPDDLDRAVQMMLRDRRAQWARANGLKRIPEAA